MSIIASSPSTSLYSSLSTSTSTSTSSPLRPLATAAPPPPPTPFQILPPVGSWVDTSIPTPPPGLQIEQLIAWGREYREDVVFTHLQALVRGEKPTIELALIDLADYHHQLVSVSISVEVM